MNKKEITIVGKDDGNTGNWNTGNWNTGNGNTGNRNTGNWNTGSKNTGDGNTGNWNRGGGNTGNWNTGDGNPGFLNTTEPKVRLFNKDCDIARDDLDFPSYFHFDLTEWIPEDAMIDEEKKEHDTYKTTGGYLRSYGYREAWRKSWENADEDDRRETLTLPNWDNKLFLEISGIDVEKELEVKSKEYSMDEIANAMGIDVKNLKIKKD